MTSLPEVSPEMISRAMAPPIEYGRNLLASASHQWGHYLLLTMPEPWQVARAMVSTPPQHVHFVESMDRPEVERVEAQLPAAERIVGLGGGQALDMAKYVAWQRGKDPLLVPSIASVDACVTNTIAVREDGRVRYIGFTVPQRVLVDYSLMQSAPPHLNRAGMGDILSIHTALRDWRIAAQQGFGTYDEAAAAETAALVDALEARADSIRAVSEEALQWLIEAYAAENAVCLRVGHSRPEEGSEHFFAYNVEHRTGKGFVHGELVALGILLMSRWQENESQRVERILAATGVRYQPVDLNLTRDEVEEALLTLLEYVENEGLPYSVIQQRPPDAEWVSTITAGLVY